MKGVIFNLLEEFVCEGWGYDTYELVMSSCPAHERGPFIGPGTYPDSVLLAIVAGTAKKLDITVEQAVRAFGKFAMSKLAAKVPELISHLESPKALLMSLENVIHIEVKKIYPMAEPPTFDYEDPADDKLIMHYYSKRNLCVLMEGLLEGLADYYETNLDFTQTHCVNHGDDHCVFDINFNKKLI